MAIGFADAFWSSDYANGVHSLFAKLQQVCDGASTKYLICAGLR